MKLPPDSFMRMRNTERIIPPHIFYLPFAIPSRSDIPYFRHMYDDTLGQQITYILVLRASYSNTLSDLAKVYNRVWHHADVLFMMKRVFNVTTLVREYRGWKPFPELDMEEFRDMWEDQTMYPKDEASMRQVLEALKLKEVTLRCPVMDESIQCWPDVFDRVMGKIECCARTVGVELVLKST